MNRHLGCLALAVALGSMNLAWAAPINVAVDIDSSRLSGSDVSGPLVTQGGFTSWNLTNVGTSGSTLLLDGVTFEIFGLAAANQSRVRVSGGNPDGGGGPLNDLLADFLFNEGASGRAVGLRVSGLDVGTYGMQSWHHDTTSTVTSTENFIQVEVRDQGVAGSTITLVDMAPFSPNALSYTFDVTAPGQVKELIFREDDVATDTDPVDQNRARLNAFRMWTIPEPASLVLIGVAAVSVAMRRRARR